MLRPKLTCLALLWAMISQVCSAQDKTPVKFGKVTPVDFDLSAYKIDSNAEAVAIADVGNSEFEGNLKGWFSLIFHHSTRIKILNKNGFGVATVTIPLYTSGNAEEKLQNLKAVTYNLEDGKVVETKLDDKSVFTEKVSRNLIHKKFTLPAIKEGSIIEYSYTQQSDFLYNLQPWQFQHEYPCLWSEYEVDMPRFLEYVTLAQGYEPYAINTTKSRRVTFRGSLPGGAEKNENFNFEDQVDDHRWVMKNVPALKEERYTTTVDNYMSKIEFQLSRYSLPDSYPKDMMGNWLMMSEKLLGSDEFGGDLDRNNGWMEDAIKSITKGQTGNLGKAQKIYAYVRDSFACSGYGSIYTTKPLKTVFTGKGGTVAELNLLLTAMLRHINIQTDPVILSTRAHGFTHEIYPLLTRFNYVVCRAVIDSSAYYLDASEPWLGFGYMPSYCYNGHARIVNKNTPSPVYFDADSIVEGKTTTVFAVNDGKGGLDCRYQSIPGYFESCRVREAMRKHGQKDFMKTLQAAYPAEMALSNLSVDSLQNREKPVQVSYDMKYKIDSSEDLIYFNPLLGEGYKDNPFASAQRKYPVEMTGMKDETYILNMEIPDGYVVDELPKSAKVLFNEDEGFFEYLVAKDDTNVQFRMHLKLKKANFKPEDYDTLREFFAFIVKKQAEQIVFKKKK